MSYTPEEIRHAFSVKWGVQHHPDGTGSQYTDSAKFYQVVNDTIAMQKGEHDWTTILLEEVYEALSETDQARLREELVQVAAVAVAWIEDIDSRKVE